MKRLIKMSFGGSITQLFHPTGYQHCSETLTLYFSLPHTAYKGRASAEGPDHRCRFYVTCYCSDSFGSWCTRRGQPAALPCTSHHPEAGRFNNQWLWKHTRDSHGERRRQFSVSWCPKTLHFQTLITLSIFRSMSRNMAWQHWAIIQSQAESFCQHVCQRKVNNCSLDKYVVISLVCFQLNMLRFNLINTL